MQVSPAEYVGIKRRPTFQSNPPFLETMFFEEIDGTSTPAAMTRARTTFSTTKKQSFVSGSMSIHPQSPSSIRSSSSVSLDRHRPSLMQKHKRSSSCSGRFAELAGGTTAECGAICCCCPFVLANLLYLTVYKLPTGLCRRALSKKRRNQLIKKGLLPAKGKRCRCGFDHADVRIHPTAGLKFEGDESEEDRDQEEKPVENDDAMIQLEKEMWESFYSTGFWRSASQKEKSFLHCD